MNVINKLFLSLALLPSRFYDKIGVDTYQLKAILDVKLTMDDRRAGVLHQARNTRKGKKVSMATVGTMVMSALLGIFFLLSFSAGQDLLTHLTIYFSLFFFLLSLTLIADFTSVLIDVRDTFIILPKPVSDKTFVVARLLHIFIHVCKVVLPMALPGMVMIAMQYGIGGMLLLLLLVFMVTSFTIMFINAAYIIILRITTPQRFQALISYVQILFAVIIFAGYQIFPRLMSEMQLQFFTVAAKPLYLLYPLYWFAALWVTLFSFSGDIFQFIAAFLGLITPFASIYLVVKYLAPSFNNKLALITGSGTDTSKPGVRKHTGRSSYATILSTLFTGNAAERMGFLFTWKMTSRSRDFKLKVYPSIGYLLVYVFFMFYQNSDMQVSAIAEENTKGKVMIIFAIYFVSFILVMALSQVSFSDKYKASWIFYTTPLEKPGNIILGSAKAAIAKFYIPMVVALTAVGLLLVGIKFLPNILLGLCNQLLIATVMVYAGSRMFPFSMHQSNNVKAGAFIRSFFVLAVSGVIGLCHFLIYSILPAVIVCMFLSGAALWLMMDSIRNLSWKSIRSVYSED